MYNRYHGNSGRYERVDDRPPPAPPPAPQAPPPPPPPPSPQSPPKGRNAPFHPPPRLGEGELGRLLRRFLPGALETEDFMVLLLLYLLYQESGDLEFLLMIGAFLVL